jgi:hypothetical protein
LILSSDNIESAKAYIKEHLLGISENNITVIPPRTHWYIDNEGVLHTISHKALVAKYGAGIRFLKNPK